MARVCDLTGSQSMLCDHYRHEDGSHFRFWQFCKT